MVKLSLSVLRNYTGGCLLWPDFVEDRFLHLPDQYPGVALVILNISFTTS